MEGIKHILKKGHLIFLVFLLASIVLGGCTKDKPEDGTDCVADSNPKDYVVGEIPEKVADGARGEKLGKPKIIEFDLGQSLIKQQYGPEMPYRMQGVMGIPAGEGQHPVVVVLHGSHRVETEEDVTARRYDLGYKYLVEELASYGYLTLSINTNAQYLFKYGEPYMFERLNVIFNDNIEKLQQAVEGNDVGYGVDLTGRADLTKLSIIGHSRGGQAPFSIYEDQKNRSRDNIKSMLLIAPSDVLLLDILSSDVPTGIILPQLDGDVVGLDGQRYFDKFFNSLDRKSWTSLVYLYGANHNFFNEALDVDDSETLSEPIIDYEKKLKPEDQRLFLKQYAVDFLTSVFDKPVPSIGVSPQETAPGSLYGYKVLTSLAVPKNSKVIWRPKGDEDVTLNLLGGENMADNVQVKFIMESYVPINDPGPFNHAGLPKKLGFLSLNWENKDASITTMIPEDNSDFSDYDSLSLYTSLDPSNPLNPKDKNQSLTIVIKDKTGNSDSVLIDSTAPTMHYQKGHIIKNPYAPYWSTYTSLNSLRVRLKYFDEIDLASVESVSLVFDQTDSGALMVGDMSLLKDADR